MKLLLTNPPKQRNFGHCFTQPDWVNLTLPYIAGFFPRAEIRIVDNSHSLEHNLLREIGEFEPDLIGWSVRSEKEYEKAFELMRRFRGYSQMAGGQAAWNHRDELDFIDPVVHDIENVDDLDATPFPRWDLVDILPSEFFENRAVGSIEMSRGCSFNCDFCATSAYWGGYREKSNERIIDELNVLRQSNRTHVYLADDNSFFNPKKSTELFKEILSRNLDMKFFAQMRTDTIARNPEMMELAKQAGLYGVLVGFDSYDESVLRHENKTTSRRLNHQAAHILRKNEIVIYGCHIYGLPGQQDPYDFEETFNYGRMNSDLFTMSFFHPLPFTKSAEHAPERGTEWQKAYADYYKRHQFSSIELDGIISHPNPITRKLKQNGFRKWLAYQKYRIQGS